MQQRNLLLFFLITALILFSWMKIASYLAPPPKPKTTAVAATDEAGKPKTAEKKAGEKKTDAKGKDEKKPQPPAFTARKTPPPTPQDKLITLGEEHRKNHPSKYHLRVILDPHGAGVRSLWLNKFQAADDYGRPVWLDKEKTEKQPLELIPAELNTRSPSFLLYAFDAADPTDDRPLDTLGRIEWTSLGKKEETLSDGRRRESVSFEATTQGVIVTKTFSLTEGEYHLGLEVRMRRKPGAKGDAVKIRYQLTGGHGLPVEGKWYTSTFRNSLIGWLDKDNSLWRDLQDLRQISHWGGGNLIRKEEGNSLLYAIEANQYFASGIVVDNDQKQRGFLRQARPTLETALTKGVVKSVNGSSFVLTPERGTEETFYVADNVGPEWRLRFHGLNKGARIAVLHHTGPAEGKEYPEIAEEFYPEDAVPALWVNDITVRVATEPVELSDKDEVVHKYLLYNGPVKVNQLAVPAGLSVKSAEEGGVDPELVRRYHDVLHLDTLTDYHSPGGMGKFSSMIGWTRLVIWCTNLMHRVLAYIHALIPNYGLCIIVLTVLVRGMMFPLSRKQAMMSLRMQQLAPELKKLQEKHKDDRQALGLAQMELYRKHGVNPFGSCWVLLLQMPIFMGLYFALQESIHFRLAEFWPTWIINLAAPDMMISWSQSIPYISRVEDYGSFFYLGPYFNLLPVIAVALMIGQQKMMTPPPADEQQAMQQKMMKYMMIFFGLMFYKVAAGLCLYFIASSVWGFCERKLLPKKKPELTEQPAKEGYFHKLLRQARSEQVTTGPSTNVIAGNGGKSGRKRRDRRERSPVVPPEEDDSALGRVRSWFRQRRERLREWWIAVLKEAEKKNRS